MTTRTMAVTQLATCALGAAMLAGAALGDPPNPVVVQPGFNVAPFSGFWAGMPPFASPKFGVLADPNQPFLPPFMYVAELGGADVAIVMPNGVWNPYTVPFFPSGAAGIDIDGKIANSLGTTMGMYGGPMMSYVAEVNTGAVDQIMPGGAWMPYVPPGMMLPGAAAVQFDRTPGFMYGGLMYVSDWGGDQTDVIMQVPPFGMPIPWAPMPGFDPRYMTFDANGGATGYGPGSLWVSSFASGIVASVLPNGMLTPPLAVLQPGIEGLSFAMGDGCFGNHLYVANLPLGTIDTIAPNGMVTPFAVGFPGAAYIIFVQHGPFAVNAKPTMYVLDGNSSIWVITPQPVPCPADLDGNGMVDGADLAILLGAWGPCPGIFCPPDLDGNGFVGAADLAILLGAWGPAGLCWPC